MLEEISKLDSEWRKIALKICGNKYLADDLVNDMYLKMHKIKPKNFNKHYISYSIYHQFLNYINKNKNTIYLEDVNTSKISYNESETDVRIRINKALDELGLLDKEMLLHTHEKSLRKVAEYLDMSYGKVNYMKKNALEKLENTKEIKNWKNER